MSTRLSLPGDSVRWPNPADLREKEGRRVGGCRGRDRARRRANAGAPAVPPAAVPRVHAPAPRAGAGQSMRLGESVRTRRRTYQPWRPGGRSGDNAPGQSSLLTYDSPYARVTRSVWAERTIQSLTQPDRSSINRVWVSAHARGKLFFTETRMPKSGA